MCCWAEQSKNDAVERKFLQVSTLQLTDQSAIRSYCFVINHREHIFKNISTLNNQFALLSNSGFLLWSTIMLPCLLFSVSSNPCLEFIPYMPDLPFYFCVKAELSPASLVFYGDPYNQGLIQSSVHAYNLVIFHECYISGLNVFVQINHYICCYFFSYLHSCRWWWYFWKLAFLQPFH